MHSRLFLVVFYLLWTSLISTHCISVIHIRLDSRQGLFTEYRLWILRSFSRRSQGYFGEVGSRGMTLEGKPQVVIPCKRSATRNPERTNFGQE
jgi:hypothetical protein